MGILLTTSVVLSLLFLLFKQIFKSFRDGRLPRGKKGYLLTFILSEVLCFFIVIISGKGGLHEGVCSLAIGTMGLYFMTLSFVPKKVVYSFLIISVILEVLYVIYRFTTLFFILPLPDVSLFQNMTVSVPLLICIVYATSLAVKISDVKFVLRSGAAWNSVCLATDVIYIIIFLIYVSVFFLIQKNVSDVTDVMNAICSIALLSLQYALVQRINTSSLFVFWEQQERRFVESMRLSHSDLTGEAPGADVLYKNIYDRVIDYFEKHRPYLNHELTVNDLVNVLFTNKLYISKAISMYTGRNFCQFVNYYRITYAVELFRNDTSLKIVDIASRSGFNSSVSFSMAFRLYIGEKPSDWFRRERVRLSKRKK